MVALFLTYTPENQAKKMVLFQALNKYWEKFNFPTMQRELVNHCYFIPIFIKYQQWDVMYLSPKKSRMNKVPAMVGVDHP